MGWPSGGGELLADDDRVDVNQVDIDGNTPLHLAITRSDKNKQLDLVRALLGNPRTSTNLRDCNGDTPLHIAARTGDKLVVQMLLSREETDLEIKNNNGNSVMESLRSYSFAFQEAIAGHVLVRCEGAG
ncbi:ankyrin repeat-containing domain protein [Tuber indicum]|nr:ankyrin repeat-containing domain protein [Tuber indicum]